jgi:hypothetical protein
MKKLPVIVSAMAAFALQSVAFAGYHATALVSVYKSGSSGSAAGSVQSARYYGTDSLEYIGCSQSTDVKSSTYVSCIARNASNVILSCYSSTANEQARDAIASINTTSFIYFQADASGKCTYITVSNASYYL